MDSWRLFRAGWGWVLSASQASVPQAVGIPGVGTSGVGIQHPTSAAYIPPVADLKVSDAQRERAAQELREHFAAGRLTNDELDERVQRAYAARTEQQLHALVADLPRLPLSPQEQRAALAERRSQLQRRLIQETGGGIALFGVCLAVWLIDGAQGQFWPVWVLLIVALPLIRNGWRLYGPAPDFERVERELDRRSRRRGRGRR